MGVQNVYGCWWKSPAHLVSNAGLRVCFVRVIFTKRQVPCPSLSGTYRDSSRFIEDWITGFADFTQPALAFTDNGRRTARGLGRFSVTAFSRNLRWSIQESSRVHEFLFKMSSAPSFVPHICGERYFSVLLQSGINIIQCCATSDWERVCVSSETKTFECQLGIMSVTTI